MLDFYANYYLLIAGKPLILLVLYKSCRSTRARKNPHNKLIYSLLCGFLKIIFLVEYLSAQSSFFRAFSCETKIILG